MKRIFLLFLYFVSVLSAISCIRELDDPVTGGKPVTVTFDISLGSDLTKADNTGLDNASGAFQLYVAAYNTADGTLVPASLIGGNGYYPTATISSGSEAQNISLTLSKGTSYKVIFFAQRTGAYDVSFADGGVASFSYKSVLNANDGNMDAFYDAVDVSGTKTSYEVTLRRPFAQLNVLVKKEDVPSTQTAFESSMTVKAPTTFDLYVGAATGDPSTINFAKKAINETPFGQYATTHTWIGMNYVLVPADGHVEVTSFQESGMVSAIAPGKVPVKKNGRTNLVGNVYSSTMGYNATFTVQVNPGFGAPDQTEPIGGEETEITIADNNTYTPENPLVISVTTTDPTSQNVALQVAGFTLSEVADAAIGDGTIEASSSNEAVATAEVDGDAVVITPKGDGEATITVTTPAFTKTDYRAASFTIPVKVEGMTPTDSDKILTHEKFGCYLPDHERIYVAGDDQYVREYKGTTLDFVLLNAGENEQVIIRGYQNTMEKGDPVTVSVDWKKGKAQILKEDYEMTVVKEENRKVWIADQEGNGFVIKK